MSVLTLLSSNLPVSLCDLTLLLCRLDADVVPLDEDFAAITSSPALEYLEMTTDVGPDCAQAMFPPQRQCNNLHDLSLDVTWLAQAGAMAHVAAACPRLEHLTFDSYGGAHLHDIPATAWAARLTALHKLTSLSFSTMDVEMAPTVFASLATLTNLRDLSLSELDSNYLGGVLRLTSCSQLTRLQVTATAVNAAVNLDITSKVGAATSSLGEGVVCCSWTRLQMVWVCKLTLLGCETCPPSHHACCPAPLCMQPSGPCRLAPRCVAADPLPRAAAGRGKL